MNMLSPPPLDPIFEIDLAHLPGNTSSNESMAIYHSFIDRYGTHFLAQMLYGSKNVYQFFMEGNTTEVRDRNEDPIALL